MISRPKFKAHSHAEVVGPDRVLLLSEAGHVVLEGRLNALLAPLINGRNQVNNIVEQLEGRAGVLDVYYGLTCLEEQGVIVEADDEEPVEVAAFREPLNVDRSTFAIRLEATGVSVTSFGAVSAELFIDVLQSLKIRTADPGEFSVVLVDDYLRHELGDFNRLAIQLNRPWMIVKPVGTIFWIGPVFRPPATGCWACLAERLTQTEGMRAIRSGRRSDDAKHPPPSAAGLTTTFQTALNIAATETLRWIVQGGNTELEGRLFTLDTKSLKWQRHVLVRQENCPQCARLRPAPPKDPEPMVLKSCKKMFSFEGAHRSATPENTFGRYQHLVSPITGIVDAVEAYRSDDGGCVHIYLAGHNFTSRHGPERVLRSLGGRSAGKGMTRVAAKTSALCEALERYSGVFRGDETRRRASYKRLGTSAIHPNACMNFSARQYRDREEWNQRESDYNWVPQPFDEEQEVDWTPVWSLTEEMFKYVPTAYCYYGYPLQKDHDFCRPDSTGNAAGCNLEEAILYGFLEVVERDCVALWWYNRLVRPGVDLESFSQPAFCALKRHYQSQGRQIYVLDITNDLAIPTFAAVSGRTDVDHPDFILGFGAHLAAEVAISRALAEVNQFLSLAGEARRPFAGELGDSSFLMPDRDTAPRNPSDFPCMWSDDLRDDVMTSMKRAQRLGMETLVLDQTRCDVGLSVVKVLVPGMRQFWARFGPGRLYDVPVTLGWSNAPLTEDELNPAHLLI